MFIYDITEVKCGTGEESALADEEVIAEGSDMMDGEGLARTTSTKCTDSDGGIDYYVKGTTDGINDASLGGRIKVTDKCDGDNLTEYLCYTLLTPAKYPVVISHDNYKCPGGCKDGADKYAKKYTLELGLQYEEYPPFHDAHNLYCVLPETVYGKPFNMKYYFVRNKQIAERSDFVVAFIPEGVPSKGSLSTIKYAEKAGKKTIIID